MRIDQFNNLPPQNIIGSRTRSSGDEFNTSLKKERRPDPPEFSTSEVEEYISYSETMDLRARQTANRSSYGSEMQNPGAKQSARRTTQSLTKSFVQQVVCMAAGAVIVTTTYNTMVEARNAERNSLSESFADAAETVGSKDTETETPQDNTNQNDTPLESFEEYDVSGIDDDENSGENGGSDGESGGNAGESSAKSNNESSKTVSRSSKDDEETKEEDSNGKNVEENKDKNAYAIENKTVENTDNHSVGSSESSGTADGEGGQSQVIRLEGHVFGTPIREELTDGSIKITYTCSECGKTYEIIISVDPEQ